MVSNVNNSLSSGDVFRRALEVLVPALFSSVMILISCVALASLIFRGDLQSYLGQGISILVLGAVAVGVFYGAIGAYKKVVCEPDEDTAPIFAAMIGATILAMAGSAPVEQKFYTALYLILISTLTIGVVLIVLGQLRAGSAVEFLPYSVMGGYFAAAGWLITTGGIDAGVGIDLEHGLDLVKSSSVHLFMLMATIGYGLFLFWVRAKALKNVYMISSMFFSIALFYLSASLFPEIVTKEVVELVTLGQLGSEANGLRIYPGFSVEVFSNVTLDFDLLIQAFPSLSVIVILSCVSTLLTLGGLNLLLQKDSQASVELKKIGFANVVAGAGGGMAAFPSTDLTRLAISIGAPETRWLSILSAILAGVLSVVAMAWIGHLPKPIVGGLLLSFGLSILYEWLVQARSHYSWQEYLVIPTILLVAIFLGFLQGILVGLFAATLIFVVKYSQTKVIRYEGNGDRFRSNVDRNLAQTTILEGRGSSVLVVGLQGYLFFGTAGRIYNRIKTLLEENESVKYIVLDFDHVHGIDASAGLNFDKLAQLTTLRQVYLLVAGLKEELRGNYSATGIDFSSAEYAAFYKDLDHALEWYEEQALDMPIEPDADKASSFLAGLRATDPDLHQLLLGYLEQVDVEEGYVLAKQGDLSDELFLLESCGASAFINDGAGGQLRVRRVCEGSIYGEIGFVLGAPRTASIIVDSPGSIYILTREQFENIEDAHPEIIAKLHQHLLGLSIQRLLLTTKTLGTVLR